MPKSKNVGPPDGSPHLMFTFEQFVPRSAVAGRVGLFAGGAQVER
jgi:hypothetical protein